MLLKGTNALREWDVRRPMWRDGVEMMMMPMTMMAMMLNGCDGKLIS